VAGPQGEEVLKREQHHCSDAVSSVAAAYHPAAARLPGKSHLMQLQLRLRHCCGLAAWAGREAQPRQQYQGLPRRTAQKAAVGYLPGVGDWQGKQRHFPADLGCLQRLRVLA